MAIEIERKFLVKNDRWRAGAAGMPYRQGYLCREPSRTVRVRIAGDAAYLTIKGASEGCARAEFEYAIPLADAESMLAICDGPLIEKTRYKVLYAGKQWEIDVFHGANRGLVLAEIELADAHEVFGLPPWAGEEVTQDPRYFNSSLSLRPVSVWLEGEKA